MVENRLMYNAPIMYNVRKTYYNTTLMIAAVRYEYVITTITNTTCLYYKTSSVSLHYN